MLPIERLRRDLDGFASSDWVRQLTDRAAASLTENAHGGLPRWRRLLASLPDVPKAAVEVSSGAITLTPDWPGRHREAVRDALMQLAPWRKGPFALGGIHIDAEWRSDWKWQRIQDAMTPLAGRRVLDVGCGNGYYALRMRCQGAQLVVGIDPTILFVAQFTAVTHFMLDEPVHVLPLRLHELPAPAPAFDTTFSMGVLYHQRRPLEHLAQLRDTLRRQGELVLETLIAPGATADVLIPQGRYARMRNVWHLPTRPRLVEWLTESGFADIRIVDETATSQDEQRTTPWMPFESLREALDPADPARTVEGLPAPLRIAVIATKSAT